MTSFWISDICVLFTSFNVNPFSDGNINHRFNSLTRLIIITAILSTIFIDIKSVLMSTIISLIFTVIFYMIRFDKSKYRIEPETLYEEENKGEIKENKVESYDLTKINSEKDYNKNIGTNKEGIKNFDATKLYKLN